MGMVYLLECFMSDTELTQETMHRILKEEPSHNWLQYLTNDEFTGEGKDKAPLLKGLRRLANIRGIADMTIDNLGVAVFKSTQHAGSELPMAYVSVRIVFADGAVVADAADAHWGNCMNYGNFPVATATSRAIGRCIARSFNIERAAEEMDPMTPYDAFGDPKELIADIQIKGIKAMAKVRKLKVDDILEALFPHKKAEDRKLEKLTSQEATKVSRYINDRKA